MIGLAVVVWMAASGRFAPSADERRVDASSAASARQNPAAGAVVILRIQAPGGMTLKAGIPAGTTGTLDVPNQLRLVLSPSLANDLVHVRIAFQGKDGSVAPVGAVDLRKGTKVSMDQPFPFQIEWVGTVRPLPNRRGPNGTRQ